MNTRGYNVVLFLGNAEAPIFEQALQCFPLHYCLSVCKKREFMPSLHAQEHAWRHPDHVDDVDWNTITPLDEEWIERLRPCEARVLAMYERLEGRGHVLSYQERKRLYLRQLRFCSHILTEEKIDLLLLTAIPHHGIAYILSALCKEKNIPVLWMNQWDPFLDLFTLDESWEDPVPLIGQRLKTLQQSSVDPASLILIPPFEEYWNLQTGMGKQRQTSNLRPWYMVVHHEFAFFQWVRLVRGVFRKNFWQFIFHTITFLPRRMSPFFLWERLRRLLWYRHARHMYRFYDKHAARQDLSKQYIYVPLHIQPEVTTLPMGGAFVDQILMLQMLNALVPEDVLLYVKEHPLQQELYPDGKGRSSVFYEDLLVCEKVRFVSKTQDTHALTENAIAVATVTGTAGFEGLFRGKAVLLFGHRYFQYASGVFMVRTVADCNHALHTILKGEGRVSPADMRVFLKACEGIVQEGSIDVAHQGVSRFSPSENAERVGKVIAGELVRRGWMKEGTRDE